MKLLIIESPGKVAKLKAILGEGWEVAASVGHVRDLPEREIGVAAPTFVPRYELTERGAKVIARLKRLAAYAETVILGTDPDREGEAIGWHLQQCLKLKTARRAAFNEITEAAVKRALANPREIDIRLVASQEARRVLDRLVGYKVGPAVSELAGERLTAGRVQSVAVRLVVDREREIQAFKPTNHFGAQLFFAGAKNEHEWSAEWLTKPKFVSDESPYFMDREFAAAVAGVKMVLVKAFDEKFTHRSPPAPFTTSSLLQAASVALKLDPKAAMEAAQKLYEQGHITYHRTDNPNVSREALPAIEAIASAIGLEMAEAFREFETPEGAQTGHPAITPTHWDVEGAGETDEQRALYRLIRVRAIASQLADARYSVRSVRLRAARPVGGHEVEFEAKGRSIVFEGWLKLLTGDQTDEEAEGEDLKNPVPLLAPGESIDVTRGAVLEKRTRAPSRYTQASLIKKLDKEGVGRPSTYAAIMDNIVAREYVTVQKSMLNPTARGETIVDLLVGKFEFMNLPFTRTMELELDKIAHGELAYKGVVEKLHDHLASELSTLAVTAAPKFACPNCGKGLRRVERGNTTIFGCSAYPECGVILREKDGAPVYEKAFACPQCSRPLVHRVKEGKDGYDFWGCTGFKDAKTPCKASFPSKNGEPDFSDAGQEKFACPSCGRDLVHRKKPGKGGYDFWGCTGYGASESPCKAHFQNKNGKPDFGNAK